MLCPNILWFHIQTLGGTASSIQHNTI
jgi:hypothetical protein